MRNGKGTFSRESKSSVSPCPSPPLSNHRANPHSVSSWNGENGDTDDDGDVRMDEEAPSVVVPDLGVRRERSKARQERAYPRFRLGRRNSSMTIQTAISVRT